MNSNALKQTSNTKAQSWIDWTNLALGAFFVASPWLALGGNGAITWNAVICGAIIACVAGAAIVTPTAGREKTNASLGVWLLIAPWVLAFSSNPGATWASVLVGLGVACLAGFQLSLLKRSARA